MVVLCVYAAKACGVESNLCLLFVLRTAYGFCLETGSLRELKKFESF